MMEQDPLNSTLQNPLGQAALGEGSLGAVFSQQIVILNFNIISPSSKSYIFLSLMRMKGRGTHTRVKKFVSANEFFEKIC